MHLNLRGKETDSSSKKKTIKTHHFRLSLSINKNESEAHEKKMLKWWKQNNFLLSRQQSWKNNKHKANNNVDDKIISYSDQVFLIFSCYTTTATATWFFSVYFLLLFVYSVLCFVFIEYYGRFYFNFVHESASQSLFRSNFGEYHHIWCWTWFFMGCLFFILHFCFGLFILLSITFVVVVVVVEQPHIIVYNHALFQKQNWKPEKKILAIEKTFVSSWLFFMLFVLLILTKTKQNKNFKNHATVLQR